MRYVHGLRGEVVATVDASGIVSRGLEPGAPIGLARGDDNVYADEAGAQLVGYVDADGRIKDDRHTIVGFVDASGRVLEPDGRVVGRVEQNVDGAVLLLLVGRLFPDVIAPPAPPERAEATIMDESLALADEHARPGIRKNYKPLTDEEVFGRVPPPKGKGG